MPVNPLYSAQSATNVEISSEELASAKVNAVDQLIDTNSQQSPSEENQQQQAAAELMQ